MVTITDQIMLSLGFPLDIRLSNVYVENSNIIVESISEYLLRVDSNSRYLGQEVTILYPSGIYNLNTFVDLINDGEIHRKKYAFYIGLLDQDFLEVHIDGVTIIDNLVEGGTNVVLSAEQGKVLKQLIDSAEVGLESDITADVSIGGINVGDTLTEGMGLTALFLKLFSKTYYPTFIAPTATFNYSGISQNVECGIISNVNLALNFDRGSILGNKVNGIWNPTTFQAYRAGLVTNYTINGLDLDLVNNRILNDYHIIQGVNTFTGIVDYGVGPQPVDSLGNNYLVPLESGSITKTININGYRNAFYGTSTGDTPLTESTEIRNLSGKLLNPAVNSTFTISIPVGAKVATFAYPASLRDVSSVQYVEGIYAEIKSKFVLSTFNVEGANGYSPIPYKVFTFIPPAAFSQAVNYKITI